MEGRTVAVIEEFTLPSQPTAGRVSYIPLGGDGYTSPFAAYVIDNASVIGDASGGPATIRCHMDARFCALVSYVSTQVQQGTSADAGFRTRVAGEIATAIMIDQGVITAVSSDVTSQEISRTWNPPAMILAGGNEDATLETILFNVLSDVYFMSAFIYLFNIRVRELTAMGPLLWARGSGTSVST